MKSNLISLPVGLLAAALVLIVLLFAAAQFRAVQAGLDHDAELVAEILTDDSGAPLLSADSRMPADKLGALRVYPSMLRACLYDQHDHLVASHVKDRANPCPEVDTEAQAVQPTVSKPVLWHDTPMGRLDLYVDRSQVLPGVLSFLAPIAALALLVVLIVAIIGRRLAETAASAQKTLTASPRDDLLGTRRAPEDDLRERRRTEEALSAAESRLRKIIDLVPYLIFAIRRDGSLIFANRAVAEAYGVSIDALLSGSFANDRTMPDRPDGLLFEHHRVRRPPSEIWFNDHGGRIKRFLVTRVPFGEPFPEQVDADSGPESELVVAVDVTEERRLQVQLQFSQRLEVVGTLAGGIAHDFNNLLTPIMGYTTMLMERDLPADVGSKLKSIHSAALKARDLVQQILTFSRHQNEAAEKQLVDSASVLEDAISLMRATIPSSIEIKVDVAPNLPLIQANPGQVHQVIVNLCTNAAQAILQPRGRIEIKLRRADASATNSPARLAKGEFIELSVSDNGAGMTPEVCARVFEPFFTTKDVGQGSGLGLSVVHGIVSGHGGEITLTSEEGKGSTFRVYLPAAESDADYVEVPDQPRAEGHERVLLIDDEVAVVRATKDLLENFGYAVEAFTQPASALRQFLALNSAFDVVVTDNLMPEMTGIELAQAIRQSDTSIPIVLMSGYIDDKAERDPAITVAISKPTSGGELSSLIQQVVQAKIA